MAQKTDPWKRVPMRVQPPEERVKNFDEVIKGYTKEEAMAEATRCLQCPTAPCQKACPISQDVPKYIKAIAEGDFDKALEIVMEKNALPYCLGNVCVHYCEEACVKGKKGDPLAIAWLKRASVDYGTIEMTPGEDTGNSVGIVGSGPAGLTAALYLRKMGHRVTIYEREDIVGGMLKTAIPPYRLSREGIEKDINRILNMGVEVRTGIDVGRDITIDELREKHDAVLISVGTHKPYTLNVPGEDMEGITFAVPFLRNVNLCRKCYIGNNVAVIGGGSSAIDCVRTLKRLGKKARIVYRRQKEQMPALKDEVVEAEEEGIEFIILTTPVGFRGDKRVEAMECVKMKLGEPDASGRPRPVPIEGSNFIMEVDMVISALGQKPDLYMIDDRFKLTKWGTLEVDENMQTSVEGVFACGDAVNGSSVIVKAMASTWRAVMGIDRYLRGK